MILQIQLAALQTLRNVVQSAITEEKHESSYELSLLMMKDLGNPIIGGVYTQLKVHCRSPPVQFFEGAESNIMNVFQIPLSTKVAASIGERLKLLVLLHSLVGGNEAQIEVLHVLLPAVIAAASANMVEETQVFETSMSFISSYKCHIFEYFTIQL